MDSKTINGFSKLSKLNKIKWLAENFFRDPEVAKRDLESFWLNNEEEQKILDGFSENTISNFHMPFGVAPNFLINDKLYAIPMVIEESSVVAAASSAAKFWLTRGGFKTQVLGTKKIGQLHFRWAGDFEKLVASTPKFRERVCAETVGITQNMEKRGGGILNMYFRDLSDQLPDIRQLIIEFETVDSMGANFINSVLEKTSVILENFILEEGYFSDKEKDYEKIMAILSNYTPECLVRAEVSCRIEDLGDFDSHSAFELAEKFYMAIQIAKIDPYRATTHNKGIYNGVDAVVLATGNDFRAIEACGHTFASRDGQYRSLSDCSLDNGIFRFWLEIPMAVGTIGGLTHLHPIARKALEMLGNPDSKRLMQIIAATGLAQNFAAVRSLVTTGIQKGHMKMHLMNILNHLKATEAEMEKASTYFSDKVISFSEVRTFVDALRVNARN